MDEKELDRFIHSLEACDRTDKRHGCTITTWKSDELLVIMKRIKGNNNAS